MFSTTSILNINNENSNKVKSLQERLNDAEELEDFLNQEKEQNREVFGDDYVDEELEQKLSKAVKRSTMLSEIEKKTPNDQMDSDDPRIVGKVLNKVALIIDKESLDMLAEELENLDEQPEENITYDLGKPSREIPPVPLFETKKENESSINTPESSNSNINKRQRSDSETEQDSKRQKQKEESPESPPFVASSIIDPSDAKENSLIYNFLFYLSQFVGLIEVYLESLDIVNQLFILVLLALSVFVIVFIVFISSKLCDKYKQYMNNKDANNKPQN
jgi:hypothetical protein